jgi:hypothetical protein
MFIVERGSAAHAQDHPRRFRPLNVAKVDLRVFGETEPQLASRRGGKDVTDVEGEHRVLAEQAARAAVGSTATWKSRSTHTSRTRRTA